MHKYAAFLVGILEVLFLQKHSPLKSFKTAEHNELVFSELG